MFDESIGNEYRVFDAGTSEGTQIKYKKDDWWYKEDNHGCEGLAEYLTSLVLSCSSLDETNYVIYEQGVINGRNGCRSHNFLQENEDCITLYRLYHNVYGVNIASVVNTLEFEQRITFVTDFVRRECNLDITPYFQQMFTIDMLVLNEDRHFNNIALIFDGQEFRSAPLFDHGTSLLTANQSVSQFDTMEVAVRKVIARPFSGSHEKMQKYFGRGFTLDYKKLYSLLEDEPDSFELRVLRYQLERYRGLLEN